MIYWKWRQADNKGFGNQADNREAIKDKRQDG